MRRTSDTPPNSLTSETFDQVTSLTPTSGVAGSLARTSPSLASAPDWLATDPVFGGLGGSLYALFDPESCSWKTPLTSLFGDWMLLQDALPRSGTMRAGRLYGRQTSARRTTAPVSGWWPTPLKHDQKSTVTPTARELAVAPPSISLKCNGLPHPHISEWLMGLPLDWSALDSEPSATP